MTEGLETSLWRYMPFIYDKATFQDNGEKAIILGWCQVGDTCILHK